MAFNASPFTSGRATPYPPRNAPPTPDMGGPSGSSAPDLGGPLSGPVGASGGNGPAASAGTAPDLGGIKAPTPPLGGPVNAPTGGNPFTPPATTSPVLGGGPNIPKQATGPATPWVNPGNASLPWSQFPAMLQHFAQWHSQGGGQKP